MVTHTRRIAPETFNAGMNAPPSARANRGDSTPSFAQQLTKSLENYLSQTSPGAQLEIQISPQISPNSGTRQFTVTVIDSSASKLAAVPLAVAAPIAAPAAAPKASPQKTYTDEADAYWAMQPPEVQVLRTIPDEGQRYELGTRLAQQGFSIDPHIMINFWDPYMTMKVRKEEGYTWVPALGQGTVMNRPGFNSPAMAPYDALNPPPGAIRVSTDFANGLEHTSPCGRSLGNSATS